MSKEKSTSIILRVEELLVFGEKIWINLKNSMKTVTFIVAIDILISVTKKGVCNERREFRKLTTNFGF